jgi:hypothetical protein
MPESKFTPAQAEELAAAFEREGVDYLFIGKSGAILLGYPDTTQDVDVFLPRSRENAERVLAALGALGFTLDAVTTVSIVAGSEIILLKGGPFALDLIHSPDGIESFEDAKSRRILAGKFPVASWTTSSRASGRQAARRICPMFGVSNNFGVNTHTGAGHDPAIGSPASIRFERMRLRTDCDPETAIPR